MATSLLDPVAQHAADVVLERGLGKPDRNALMAGVLAQRTPRSGLFSKDSKVKERDLRVFLFDCAIVLLAPKDKDKDGEAGWALFCDPIPIELITLRAPRLSPPTSPVPTSRRRSWFLDRLPASPVSPPARAKTPPPFSSPRLGSVPNTPQRTPPSSSSLPLAPPVADEFALVLSTLGKKDAAAARIWPLTLNAANEGEQRSWAQCVSTRQEEVRMRGRDGAGRGWRLVPIHLGPASSGMGKITCYVDYDVGFHKARLWGTPEGLYEHILTAPNQGTAVRKILALPGITHVLVMDFDEQQTAYLAPFPGPGSMLEVSRLKRIGTNITHIAAGVLVLQPQPLPGTPPSAFVDPSSEKRERRKSATLTKPPPRTAVISGASSSKSDVVSALRVTKEREKEKDGESMRTAGATAAPTAAPAPAVDAPSATATAPSTTAARSVTPALAPAPASRQSLSPGKSKRRLSDIGIFALWRRKPEKDKANKKEKEKAPTSPAPSSTRFSTVTVESKPKTSTTTLKPGHGYDGPPLSKSKSATLPASLMRLPSLEFDREDPLNGNANGNGKAKEADGANGKATDGKETTAHEARSITTGTHDETGVLTNSPKPSAFSQTLPSRSSTAAGPLGRGIGLSRKRTTDSSSSRPAASGPPPKIQIALDFPSIAWPSVLDADGKAEGGDRFAGSDFLADVQRDLGDLVAGGLGMSLSEEMAETSVGEDGGMFGGPRSLVPETITEEPSKMKAPEAVQGSANGNGAQEPSGAQPAAPVQQPVPAQVAPQPQIPVAQPQAAPRPPQPQHTRFLVLSKSTTLSTTVRLYTVGGLKIEDEGDIGGGRLSFHKEFYVPSQTFSIDFLRSRICFSGGDGFEIMDPTTGKLDPFLDPVEMTEPEGPLGFLITHPRRPKPSAVFRVEQKFLCCYDEFAFFLDKFGKRARKDWLVNWHGTPTSFAVQYPYLFAFEPEFTEIRHCATGELLQLIPQPNSTRLLAGEFIAPAQKQDGVPLRRVNGEVLLVSEGSLYALRPMK
ncbi:RHO1 GDP-GTP exchange protein 2 [Ceratobasidium sp. 414]|nr:RHO1 GDP-GTP exchange protein 2 [Ceratobasidium sp. 414]